jgi:hypothetical protein
VELLGRTVAGAVPHVDSSSSSRGTSEENHGRANPDAPAEAAQAVRGASVKTNASRQSSLAPNPLTLRAPVDTGKMRKAVST